MKKTYHLCLSAGDEVMFRDLEDYNRGFNCFALALYKTGSTGLVEAFMATHTHQMVQTGNPKEMMFLFRQSYSKYFNHKYHRNGRLGERLHFTMEIIGYHHILAAASYILRNPLHHGVVSIPYAYPHCSVNSIFRREMGKIYDERPLPRKSYPRYIGRRAEYPDSYQMSESGIFLRETVLDIPQVENMFISPRIFNFYMSRKSSEEWETEQKRDGNNIPPVNLTSMENSVKMQDTDKMLIFESGKSDYKKISDIELCTELDELVRKRFGRHSVYQLSSKEKHQIAEDLYRNRHLNLAQIRRCLVIPEEL